MKAYELTLDEYRQQVTPLLKKLFAFAKANKLSMFPGDYNGVVLVDFETAAINRYGGYKYHTHEEKLDLFARDIHNGMSKQPIRTLAPALREQYDSLIAQLGEYFATEQLVPQERYSLTLQRDELNSNKREVRRAIDSGTYAAAVEAGQLSLERIREILDSLGLRMPKRLEVEERERQRLILFKRNPVMLKFMESIMASFESEREAYTQRYTQLYRAQCAKHVELMAKATTYSGSVEVKDYLSRTLQLNYYRLFESVPGTGYAVAAKPDLNEQIDNAVQYLIAALSEHMVRTLCLKVEMVLSSLVDVEKIYMTSGSEGFEGSFKFTLTDGSFVIETKAVFVHGEIVSPHYRYIAHYKHVRKGEDYLGTRNFEQMVHDFGKELV